MAFLLGDSHERQTNRLISRDPSPLTPGSCPAVTAGKPNGASDLARERFLLFFGFPDTFLVAEFPGFFEFVLELDQSAPIVGLRLRIEHLTCMAEVGRARVGPG